MAGGAAHRGHEAQRSRFQLISRDMWTISYRSNINGRWTVEQITVTADSRTEAIRKADKWPGIIIKVIRIPEV